MCQFLTQSLRQLSRGRQEPRGTNNEQLMSFFQASGPSTPDVRITREWMKEFEEKSLDASQDLSLKICRSECSNISIQ